MLRHLGDPSFNLKCYLPGIIFPGFPWIEGKETDELLGQAELTLVVTLGRAVTEWHISI